MSLRTSQKTTSTSYRTVNVAPQEQVTSTSYRTVNVAPQEQVSTTSYRTVNVAPQEQVTRTAYRTVNVAPQKQVTGTLISAGSLSPQNDYSYEQVRYLVPVQQGLQQQHHQNFMMMPQQVMQPMMQQVMQPMVQPMMQQMVRCVSPMYLQTLPRQQLLSVSSQDSDMYVQQQQTVESISGKSSVYSLSSSPVKSPEPSAEEEDFCCCINI